MPLPVLLAAGAALAGEFVPDELTFLADPAWPACDQSVVTGFEDAPMASYVEDRYAEEGLYLTASTSGAVVDDDVAGTACRDTRCARAPIVEGYGATEPQWLLLDLDTATQVLSFWLVDFGTGGEGATATVEGYLDGTSVESFTFEPGGDDEDGGVFVGLVFSSPVDQVYLWTGVAGDGIGIDDVRFPGAACSDDDGDGVSEYEGDCDDTDPTTSPGAVEACDGVDNACAGAVPSDEADADFDGWLDCLDTDGDGVTTAAGDCDPWEPTVYPGAPELCDGVDDACVGSVPAAELDTDFDGWLDCLDTDNDGVTTAAGDCDPWEPTVYPGAPELCDGLDDACAGQVPADELDADFDGWLDCLDTDGDGVTTAAGDCDPHDATVHPGAPELCDGLDDACAGQVPADELDTDFDGWLDCLDTDGDGITTAAGDCDPHDATVYPGAPELCDGLDDACAGEVPADEVDADRDGFAICAGDCDDDDPNRFPGAVERDNGWDDDCDDHAAGEVVGCAHTPPRALPGLVITAAVVVLLRRRRRSAVALAVGFASLPVLAALPAGLDAWEDEITAAAYADELAATNHGRQIVLQLSEHAVEDLLVQWFHDNPDALAYEHDWHVRTPIPWLSSAQDFGMRIWVRDADVTFLDGERISLTLSIEGWLQDLSGRVEPSTISGDVVVTADLSLVEDRTTTPPTASVELVGMSVDPTGLVVDGYLGTGPFSSWVHNAVASAFSYGLTGFGVDVSAIYRAIDTDDLPVEITGVDPRYALTVGVDDVAIKTIETPTNGGDSLLMIGADVADLPECHASAAASGEYTLFSPDAWDTFEASLIPAGDDIALSVSTRLVERMFWNLVWNADWDGLSVWEQTRAIESSLARNAAVSSYDFDRETNWDWFLNDNAIEDATVPRCDGWSDGSQVLDVDAAGNPFFRVRYWAHLEHGWGCDSTGGFDVAMRFFVDNGDYGEPSLFLDLTADSELNPTSLADMADALGCADTSEIGEVQRQLTRETTEITAVGMRRFLDLSYAVGDGTSLVFPHMTPHPATLTFSGRLTTETSPGRWGDPWSPPVGTILGLNADVGDAPVLAGGANPLQRLCPVGYESRVATISDVDLAWCEFADSDAAADPTTLPENAWCGLDVHPRNVDEICDNEDNDGDGDVDEDFSFDGGYTDLDGNAIADCFHELGGGDADTTNDAWPTDYASTCGGTNPRDACPAGFAQHAIWLDDDYALCLHDPTTCTLTDEEVLAEADLVTCLADGSAFDPADAAELPEGLVGAGYVPAYSDEIATFDGAACASPYEPVSIDAGMGRTRIRTFDEYGGLSWVNLGSDAGSIVYCTTPGPGADEDADGLTPTEEAALSSDDAAWSTDGDILSDALEVDQGFAAGELDSDGDGLDDFVEWLVTGTDAEDTDSDDDGLPDGYELWVTHDEPTDADTDDDGILDGEEESLQDIDDDWYDGLKPGEEAAEAEGEGTFDTGVDGLGSGG